MIHGHDCVARSVWALWACGGRQAHTRPSGTGRTGVGGERKETAQQREQQEQNEAAEGAWMWERVTPVCLVGWRGCGALTIGQDGKDVEH